MFTRNTREVICPHAVDEAVPPQGRFTLLGVTNTGALPTVSMGAMLPLYTAGLRVPARRPIASMAARTGTHTCTARRTRTAIFARHPGDVLPLHQRSVDG